MTLVLEDLADEAVRQLVTREVKDTKAANKVMFVGVVFDMTDEALFAGGAVLRGGASGVGRALGGGGNEAGRVVKVVGCASVRVVDKASVLAKLGSPL